MQTCLSTPVALMKMARPLIIAAGVLAYALGVAMAHFDSGAIDPSAAFLGLAIMVSAIVMAHFVDEYSDVDTDSHAERTLLSGGSGVLASGQARISLALYAALISLGIAVILTVLGIVAEVLPFIVAPIVGLGILGGWTYSMSPARLIRRGWGEVDNALLGGFLMPLIGYASQTGEVTERAFLACVPVFMIVMANLLGIHWPDVLTDRQSGKLTLAVRFGSRTRPLFLFLTITAYLLVFVFSGSLYPVLVGIATAFTLPLGVYSVFAFMDDPRPLPGAMAMVAMMISMTIGWMIA
jgi:1,4-dihydroxy-2-naphthoate octaprenyltransferase